MKSNVPGAVSFTGVRLCYAAPNERGRAERYVRQLAKWARPSGYVEHIGNGQISGWYVHKSTIAECKVSVGGVDARCEILWYDREDVQNIHQNAPLNTGFHITIAPVLYAALAKAKASDIVVRIGRDRIPLTPSVKEEFKEYWSSARLEKDAAGVGQNPGRAGAHGSLVQNGLLLQLLQRDVPRYESVTFRVGDVEAPVVFRRMADQSGGEVELPPWVWDHKGDQGALSVSLSAGDQLLGKVDLNIYSAVHSLWALKFHALTDSAEVLLGLEHARYLVKHVEFSAPLAALLTGMGQLFGCLDYLTEFFPTSMEDPTYGLPQPTDSDLRFLNARKEVHRFVLNGGEVTPELFQTTTSKYNLDASQQNSLVDSWVANMCRMGKFDKIAAVPDDDRIMVLAESNNADKATIALPFLIDRGRVEEACEVMKQLAVLPGWVNTECVFEASERYARTLGQEDHERPFLEALIVYLEKINGRYWERLYDRHMARVLLPWIERFHHLPDRYRRRVVDAALKTVSLSRDFWEGCPVPARMCTYARRLEYGRAAFQTLSEQISLDRSDQDRSAMLAAAKVLKDFGNRDAEGVIRELLLQPVGAEADSHILNENLVLMDAPEQLRFASHPKQLTQAGAFDLEQIKDFVFETSGSGDGKTVPRHAALQSLNGARISAGDLEQGRVGFEELVEDAMALSGGGTGWLSADVLLRYAEQVTDPDMRGRFLAKAQDALDFAAETGVTFDEFPALQLAQDKLKRMMTGASAAASKDTSLVLPGPQDTLVIIYCCRRNLEDRIPPLRRTWIARLKERGIPYVVLVGDGDDTQEGDILYLDVADTYEALPAKSLKMVEWVYENTDYQYLLKVDDDCYLGVDHFFDTMSYRKDHYYGRVINRGVGDTARKWHHVKSSGQEARQRLDRSPEPSQYCDGSTGYTLSRHAMGRLVQASKSGAGRHLISMSYFEDKLVGDLLALEGIEASGADYLTHILRKTEGGNMPVTTYQNSFFPSKSCPISMVHLDEVKSMDRLHDHAGTSLMSPQKIWPTHIKPHLGYNTHAQELLSDPARLDQLDKAHIVLVAVMRNEMTILPHFLAHYRALGVEAFLIADNLSDDGSREYLLEQGDVTLYSADSEYRDSHFGVDWQQALLGNHCLGKWVVLVDTDEFLTFPGIKDKALPDVVKELDARGYDGARAMLIDMYPEGALSDCDLAKGAPFDLAPYHDDPPMQQVFGSGKFSNTEKQYTSSLRHRLMPNSNESLFMATKFPLLRYSPLMRLSEGIHFVGNLNVSPEDLTLAHFKYHAEFASKVTREIKRAQHFDGGVEYKKYGAMLGRTKGKLFEAGKSKKLPDDLLPEPGLTRRESQKKEAVHGD